ncbi:MAG: metallophosphoesterase [Candidatus Methylacidiphilaceae bacterium]
MEEDFERADRRSSPSFFYIIGDVVYYHGEPREYYPQFYEPYLHYPAPIFAIPGNHDGDPNPRNPESTTLDGFLENFCSPAPVLTPDAGDSTRTAMTLPNPYWVMDGPWIRIIGLYTNVPEGGEVHDLQKEWFCEELKKAPEDKPLILALHHPIYSADSHHGGSLAMEKLLFWAAERSGKWPDLVLTGHVHNYQRFTLSREGRNIPVIVAGAGGYWYLHYMASVLRGIQGPVGIEGREDLVLESFCDDRHGFLRFEVNAADIFCEYLTVPRPHESWRSSPLLWDSFRLDRKTRTLSST